SAMMTHDISRCRKGQAMTMRGSLSVSTSRRVILCVLSGVMVAAAEPTYAQDGQNYTFESLHPEFLRTQITPAYAHYEQPTSPAEYSPENNDFLAQFSSPTGKRVTVVVKSPITNKEYDVPPRKSGQTLVDYLDSAFLADGQPRSGTIIKFPKDAYD